MNLYSQVLTVFVLGFVVTTVIHSISWDFAYFARRLISFAPWRLRSSNTVADAVVPTGPVDVEVRDWPPASWS